MNKCETVAVFCDDFCYNERVVAIACHQKHYNNKTEMFLAFLTSERPGGNPVPERG